MNNLKLPLVALALAFAPYTILQHVKVMEVPLGTFLGEWSYAQGLDIPAKLLNSFACSKGEAISCSLLAEIKAEAGELIEASNLTMKACKLGLASSCPDAMKILH